MPLIICLCKPYAASDITTKQQLTLEAFWNIGPFTLFKGLPNRAASHSVLLQLLHADSAVRRKLRWDTKLSDDCKVFLNHNLRALIKKKSCILRRLTYMRYMRDASTCSWTAR